MKNLKRYWPLFVLIVIAGLAAFALSSIKEGGWMHFFMGFLLCQFAMLKLFHPNDFADGFQMYDRAAKNNRLYAYVFPYAELALGLGYLAFGFPILVYLLTIVIYGFGAIWVIRALSKGLDVRCACMGTILDVPLSTVTLLEDIMMVVMALILLVSMAAS